MNSSKYKLTFVHVPKVAGGSILRANIPFKVLNHDIRKKEFKYLKDIKKSPNEFIFAFVRNPWDRCVSAFRWVSSGGNNNNDEKDAQEYLGKYRSDFSAFVKHYKDCDKILEQIHFQPQYKWVCDDHDNLLVDFVGRFENLQEDFDKLCDTIEAPRQKLMHHKKPKTKHKHYREYYDDETKQIVAEKYAKDIEYFGYTFGE